MQISGLREALVDWTDIDYAEFYLACSLGSHES